MAGLLAPIDRRNQGGEWKLLFNVDITLPDITSDDF